MKRVKIMLTAITVFAVVGGALAFKAKTFTPQVFCYTDSTDPSSCPLFEEGVLKTVAGSGVLYTIVNTTTDCPNVTCPNPAETFIGE